MSVKVVQITIPSDRNMPDIINTFSPEENYLMIKIGSVICKDIEIETIQLGESRKSKRLMWFIIGENSTHDQIGKISVMFKQYIKDILTTTSLDEEKKNKLVNLLRPTPSGILKLRELFKEK